MLQIGKYLLVITVIFIGFNNCKPSYDIVNGLQSDNPGIIINSYDSFINNEERDVSMLLELDTGPFCRHGLQIISELGPEVSIELLELLSEITDNNKKLKLISCFGVIGELDDNTTMRLVEESNEGNTDVRKMICRVWESSHPRNQFIQDSLLEALKSEDSNLIKSSVYVIAQIANSQDNVYFPELISLWENNESPLIMWENNESPLIKIPIAAALYNMGYEQDNMLHYIRNIAPQNSAYARIALRALSKIPEIDMASEIRPLIFEHNTLFSQSVILGIIEYGPINEIREILIECLNSDNPDITRTAINQLSFLGPEHSDIREHIEYILKNQEGNSNNGMEDVIKQSLVWMDQSKAYAYRYWQSYFSAFIQ